MKKYITFAVSFILLFTLFQVLSGILLTLTYTPNMEEAWNMNAILTHETIIKSSHNPILLTFITAFLSASIAYFISEKIKNTNNQRY